MSHTLYRKYRPQNFADVVDQNHIKITLQNEILSGQIAHAYLFTGPHGVGKTTLARILAKSLNCQSRKEKEFEPCDKCDSCKNIIAGKNLDLIEIDAATHTQVDKVRENIVENVRFAPHGSKYKVFIIDEVHMLSTAAFNSLLKTLEEPPEYIVFILCTTEIYKLPETIISRCQRFDFKKVPAEQVKNKLVKIVNKEKLKIADDVLYTIALRSGGFMRDAESMLGQIVTLIPDDKKEIKLEDIEPILPHSDFTAISDLVDNLIIDNIKNAIEIINLLINNGIDLERFNLDLIDYLRKILLIKSGLQNKDYNIAGLPKEIKEKIITQAEKINLKKLTSALNVFMAAQINLKNAEIPQLPLELAILEIIEKTQEPKNIKTEEPITKTTQPVKPSPVVQEKNIKDEKKTTNNIKISLDEIKKRWSEFMKEVQQVNHSLPLILQSAYPLNLTGNLLELGFEFDLHVKKMKDEACLKSAEQVLQKIFNEPIKIKSIVMSAEQKAEIKNSQPHKIKISVGKTDKKYKETKNQNPIDALLKSFGGKEIK